MAGKKAPEVAAAPEVTPAAAPAPDASAAPDASLSGLPRVDISVFLLVCGLKPDQTAGFKAWAKSQKLGARTIPEWHTALTNHANRPV